MQNVSEDKKLGAPEKVTELSGGGLDGSGAILLAF